MSPLALLAYLLEIMARQAVLIAAASPVESDREDVNEVARPFGIGD